MPPSTTDPSRKAAGNRRALVILALSAIFAVVLSTISLPGDNATAQVADASTDVEKRAAAWWGVLTAEERVNVLLGKGFDPGNPVVARSQRNYDQLIAVDKTAVNYRVDGSHGGSDPYEDIYSVGNHLGTGIQGIRKLQSVKLWWNHLSCVEARVAVGEDFNALSDDFDHDSNTTTNNILEPSSICKFDSDADVGGTTDNAELIPYDSLGATAKTQANEVGNALLGLTNGGTYSEDDNAIAKRWWNSLHVLYLTTPHYELKAQALYGDGADLSDNDANNETPAEKAQKVYDSLDTGTKALVNDRAMLIYGDGGSGGKYEGVDVWWDSLGCLEKQIAVGADNEPGTAGSGFCQKFDSLDDAQDRNGTSEGYYIHIEGRGASDRERALTVGRALLNLPSIPDIASWWNTLSGTQMDTPIGTQRVNVVYGNPLLTEDADGDDSTPETPVASEADRKAFQKMYEELGTAYVVASDIPAVTTALLTRHGVSTTDFDHDGDDTNANVSGYAVKDVVDAIATEIFDPPHSLPGAFRRTGNSEIVDKDDNSILTNVTSNQPDDDNEFDPPYQSVADWWENLDCRTMRMAVGEDNDYLTVDTDILMTGYQNEASIYCGHLPGATAATDTNTVSADVQTRIEAVGTALLARSEVGRPSFNAPVSGSPVVKGTTQVGSTLEADTSGISDEDGIGTFSYQWLRTTNPTVEIPGAENKTYTVQAADIGATLSVLVSYMDDERYTESTTSAETNIVAGSLGNISKIEPAIRGVTVSGGDNVTLELELYGVQGDMDNTLSGIISWSVDGTSIAASGREITYTAPSSPGTYIVKATLAEGDCRPNNEADREAACSASFEVKVRRSSPPQPEPEAPANPPGDIPTILTDSEGNQYEVFTPVEGGTFDPGEGYSIVAPSGAVPNGEFIGVRMSDDGAASNMGMTHQRYTLGGNMYGVHVVDSTGTSVSDYLLEDAAKVCVPLPNAFRGRISDLALVTINSDSTLTILAANVRLNDGGASVCGNLSNLPASLAVGSMGAPDAIPTATPIPTPEPPETGGTAPTSNGPLYLLLLLGTTATVLGISLLATRRRRQQHPNATNTP